MADRRAVIGLLMAALASACASVPRCPAQGGPVWRELQSEHFVLHTDLRLARAQEAMKELETLRAAVLTAVFPGAPRPTGQIPVIVVADRDHWEEYFPDHDGFFGRALWQPLIAMRASHRMEDEELIKHELVHYLSQFYLPVQPRWFAEGVASYFETLWYDARDRVVSFGRPPDGLLRQTHRERVLPLPEVVAGDDGAWREQPERFYATSWLMVHYLINRQPRAFSAYQRRLQTLGPMEAWRETFGGVEEMTTLATDLERYLDGGKYLVLTTAFTPPVVNARVRVETDAEAHVQRALLHHAGGLAGGDRAAALGQALANVNEALRQEPLNPTALLLRQTLLATPVTEAVARAAVAQHPRDWRAWTLLAAALEVTAGKESKVARARARLLAADNPAVSLDDQGKSHH